jgi:hypothetical protein
MATAISSLSSQPTKLRRPVQPAQAKQGLDPSSPTHSSGRWDGYLPEESEWNFKTFDR